MTVWLRFILEASIQTMLIKLTLITLLVTLYSTTHVLHVLVVGEDVLLAEDELLQLLLREPVGDVGQVGPVLLANLPRRSEVLHHRRDPHADVANLRVKQLGIIFMLCP